MDSLAVPSRATAVAQAQGRKRRAPGDWLVRFALFQFFCQLMLLVPSLGGARVIIRIAAFGASLMLVAFLRGEGRTIAVHYWAYVVLGIIAIEVVHPEGSFPGAFAALALYTAIIGPAFWVGRLGVTPRTLGRLFLAMWAFYTASATLGVLQAYFPGHFQPPLSAVVAQLGKGVVKSLEIRLASGEHVFRPMGLTDTPGGAAYGGVYAVLFGLGLLQTRKAFFGARPLALLSMVIGMTCLYLCQVRAAVVMLSICVVVLVVLAAISGQASRFLIAAAVVAIAVPVAFTLALSLGGHGVTDRLSTLTQGDPSAIYYKNRGLFLEHTINVLLPLFPFGAGLGRWGMINVYFGSPTGSLYVEIQWTAWLLDGGVPLIIAYVALIAATTWRCLRGALRYGGNGALGVWPSVVVAYNVGALALCFSYVEFIGTSGLEFWLLNGAVLAAIDQFPETARLQTSS
jgi:hypothetical protein